MEALIPFPTYDLMPSTKKTVFKCHILLWPGNAGLSRDLLDQDNLENDVEQ